MQLTVFGAGAWGTALAAQAATRHSTKLWARDAVQAATMESARCNTRYLPGIAFPAGLGIESDFLAAQAHADRRDGLLIVATPMSALGETLACLGDGPAGVIWLCKGFEPPGGRLGHEIAGAMAREGGSRRRFGVLSGPSFALEVARGQPTALVAASADRALAQTVAEVFHAGALRVYTSDDPVGVEVGGAVKNVLAIATGIADGMPVAGGGSGSGGGNDGEGRGLGLNARAALITRGLAEMTRLGVALGARPATFTGLSGLGDLVLTATGPLSRNRQVGLRLAHGEPLDRILAELGHVAEGVPSASMVLRRAAALGVEMPIVAAVAAVLEGHISPARALAGLMSRDAGAEGA